MSVVLCLSSKSSIALSLAGEHPRLGALDVCPFVPVKGVDMDDCVECAKEFAERLAAEIGVPGQ